MPLEILAGQREYVGLWMLERLPEVTDLPGGYEAIGFMRDGRLVGGALFTDYSPCPGGGDIRIWAAGHNWISRRVIRTVFGYAFDQLKCNRITAITRKNNKTTRTFLEGLGFVLEGKAREGFGPGKDAVIYGLLKSEQRIT